MRVLMFRHAERENTGSPNPPLSLRGLKQAVKLAQEIQAGGLPRPNRLYCSPKVRAYQTFYQIHLALGLELNTLADLDERKGSESMSQFETRVQKFLQFIESQSGITYFVTHLDWIDEALLRIQSDSDLSQDSFQNWPPGKGAEFEVHDGIWMFQESKIINAD